MLASSRSQWEAAHRRLDEERSDPVRHRQLLDLMDVVTAGLRRRLGSTFTLAELDALYAESERWAPAAVVEALPRDGARVTVGDVAVVLDAAFDRYARGAIDHRP